MASAMPYSCKLLVKLSFDFPPKYHSIFHPILQISLHYLVKCWYQKISETCTANSDKSQGSVATFEGVLRFLMPKILPMKKKYQNRWAFSEVTIKRVLHCFTVYYWVDRRVHGITFVILCGVWVPVALWQLCELLYTCCSLAYLHYFAAHKQALDARAFADTTAVLCLQKGTKLGILIGSHALSMKRSRRRAALRINPKSQWWRALLS